MSPREIWTAMQKASLRDPPSESDRALLAVLDLLVGFLDATTGPDGYPAAMKAMTMDQVRYLNQFHVAVGR